jgi:hypothetical protein
MEPDVTELAATELEVTLTPMLDTPEVGSDGEDTIEFDRSAE